MQISLIDDFEEFKQIRKNWDAIYEADPQAQFFLSWVWLSGWFQAKDHPWFVLAARPDNTSSYVAFFPLGDMTFRKYGIELYQELYMAGGSLADYTGFICLPEYEEQVIPAFATYVQQQLRWFIFHLKNVFDKDSRLCLFLNKFSQKYFKFYQLDLKVKQDNTDVNNCSCPYIPLPEDWERYLQNFLSSNSRQKLRRFLRKIENSEHFHITHIQEDNLESQIETLLKLWQLRWGEKPKSLLNSLRGIFRRCFENNCLYLPILWYKGEPIVAVANFLDFNKKAVLFYLAGRQDKVKVNNPPPGIALQAYSIRHAIQNGFKTYDFLRGNEAYKFSFGAKERFINYVIVKRDNMNY